MAWDFDEGGKFGSEKAAADYARRNGLKDADFRTRRKGDQVEQEIRRSAIDGRNLRDSNERRRDGWN
ncbi:hypothetical protein PX554_20900 [Sphingomonas sp. H39-1-10]|uniref:hypothetical protein n=1 Tax=Sphingomonas pollutisoli TaxID=3030829 RepID=UPI0023B943DA|nr:hypothetical protein [Sphingomonas pollutisoli]MDF0490595.1 hypothetical protein [Sphingomonas pollutisoli]